MYLYDTNIVSELRKRHRNQNVINFDNWVNQCRQPILLSVITYGETIKGIEKLKRQGDFAQANIIEQWFNTMLRPIEHLALPFDLKCAKVWGKLIAINPHNVEDKQIVATALVHDLILVTRNVKDIEKTGVKFINPFEFQS